ncbi:MAG: glycosyl transferase family 90, partial [Marinobacter sp.]
AAIETRVSYYNRLARPVSPSSQWERIAAFSTAGKSSAYCADFQHLIRHFPGHLRVNYRFGDLTTVPEQPTLVKSRPIAPSSANGNSLLLKLNSVRHYCFHRDPVPFRDKKPMAVWRGKSNREHRIGFARQFMDHPRCDIGCTLHKECAPQPWHKPFMTIGEQLGYRFIVSVEGIDVATNLKWIMASNSLCLMRRPRYETWFMEGTLVPGYHYVELKDDHSDLPEKIDYYCRHPEEAEAIIANAQGYVAQFTDRRQEDLIGLLVMERLFQLSGQSTPPSPLPAGA